MRTCAFCGGPANSKEHAWPEWVIALFRGQGDASILAERDGEKPRQWRGSKASVQVKRVCHGCNTGWMSNLENEARPFLLPLIRGESTTLDGRQRIIVALWCLKTAMVFDLTRAGHKVSFLQQERDYLYDSRGKMAMGCPFPPHTFIWLAAYNGGRFTMSAVASELVGAGVVPATQKEHHIRANVVTLLAGAFVAQVLVARLPSEAESRPPVLHEGAETWERACVQIWPLVGTRISMPPQLLLDDDHANFDGFAFRWPQVTTNPRRLRELDAGARASLSSLARSPVRRIDSDTLESSALNPREKR
jgi:hypothetical protein